ncbi:MAG: Flp pilus assembly protein CpaB [Chloroflexi bacterium]|nr:Flp pilus assembly protein CpaB [Chloroflexota bacterium]
MDELEFKDHGRRGRWIIVVGVILALVAGGGGFYLLTQAQQQAATQGVPQASVVVAVREIPARKPIEEGDVALRQVAQDVTNASALTAVADAVGRISAVTIPTGQLVTKNLLASVAAGGQFSILGPDASIAPDSPNLRAISVSVPDDRAVGGLIEPGQTVDVFITVTVNVPQDVADQGRLYTDKSTKLTYQDVPVLAKSGTFYVLRVDETTAEQISHLQASGTASFSLALRPPEDSRTVDVSGLGETTNRIIQEYGLPVPETYPRAGGPLATPAP